MTQDSDEPSQDSGVQHSELEDLTFELFGKKSIIYSKKEIEDFLAEAIQDEQYERAAKLKRYLELL